MAQAPVELRVGGQVYRVVASTDQGELQSLAAIVDKKLKELKVPGRAFEQNLLLVALALAHEAQQAQQQLATSETRSREMLRELLGRVDQALGADDPDDSPVADISFDAPAAAPSAVIDS